MSITTQCTKKLCQDLFTLLVKDTAHQRGTVGEFFHKEVQNTAASSHGTISRPVKNFWDPGIDDGTGAHGARFKGNIEGTVLQPPTAKRAIGIADRLGLRVRQRALLFFAAIAAAAYDRTVTDDNAANGNFP